MAKIYFKKQKFTNDVTIRYFYFNKNTDDKSELEFLKNKIKSLLDSKLTSAGVKKQLNKLKSIDFTRFNCFYIYSNDLKFAIDDNNVVLFDKNFYCLFDKKVADDKIKICKLKINSSDSNDSIDSDVLPTDDKSND